MNYQVPLSLIYISLGYCLQLCGRASRKPLLKSLARLCYGATLVFGLSEVAAYLRSPGITLEEFIKPTSPIHGNLSFHSALGITLAATSGLAVSLLNPEKPWMLLVSQSLILLLISLSAFGIAENLGNSSTFRFLMGFPASLGWFLFGLALFFHPYEKLPLSAPFFAGGLIYRYTIVTCILWLLMIVWQAVWTNAALGITNFTEYHIQVSAVIDELIEVVFSAFVLGLGLHILSTMTQLSILKNNLQEANRKLEAALENIGMLSSTLSHDLKTPIKIQMNSVEMLKSGQYGDQIPDPVVQEVLSALIDSKQFEYELVLNLVDLMRYKMREERFTPKPFEVQKLFSDIDRELRPAAERKDQVLVVQTDLNGMQVTADYVGMKRILHNLVNNAIQHIGPGCRIVVEATDRDGGLLFRIKDNGPGIPLDKQGNLFSRFNRVSSSGLGLYITRQIVTRHGGEIWVDSQPGQGTMFSFTIPAS